MEFRPPAFPFFHPAFAIGHFQGARAAAWCCDVSGDDELAGEPPALLGEGIGSPVKNWNRPVTLAPLQSSMVCIKGGNLLETANWLSAGFQPEPARANFLGRPGIAPGRASRRQISPAHEPERRSRNFHAPMFPKMDVREIAEARIGERREQRMREINLTEQCVIAAGLGDLNCGQTRERGERRRGLRVSQNQERGFAARQPVAHGRSFCRRELSRNDGEGGLIQQLGRKNGLNRRRNDFTLRRGVSGKLVGR
jgi:hypothetical protein